MFRHVAFAAGGMLVAASAFAADLPLPAEVAPVTAPSVAYNWTGIYIGAQGGFGWANSTHFEVADPADNSGEFDIDGWLAGGEAGANWQAGVLVLGLEGDMAWSNIGGTTNCGPVDCSTEIDWFGTVRGRVGLAWDRFMPFVTGGLAFAETDVGEPGIPIPDGTNKDWVFGWTAGGGIELGLTPHLSVKGEALWVDLDDSNYGGANIPAIGVNIDDFVVARGGVNLRF